MSFRQRESVDYFLASVINNKADKSQCLPSCKLIRKKQVYQRLTYLITCCNSYQTSNVGFDSREDRYGLFVTFDREVEETRSHLSIGKSIRKLV